MNDQLTKHKYINLETFRKSGIGVRTPVWFIQDDSVIYVRTLADSAKVKRVRKNGQVQIAVCKVDGALLGEWLPAEAREVRDGDLDRKVDHLLDLKYGLTKKMFDLLTGLRGYKSTILEVKARQ